MPDRYVLVIRLVLPNLVFLFVEKLLKEILCRCTIKSIGTYNILLTLPGMSLSVPININWSWAYPHHYAVNWQIRVSDILPRHATLICSL